MYLNLYLNRYVYIFGDICILIDWIYLLLLLDVEVADVLRFFFDLEEVGFILIFIVFIFKVFSWVLFKIK